MKLIPLKLSVPTYLLESVYVSVGMQALVEGLWCKVCEAIDGAITASFFVTEGMGWEASRSTVVELGTWCLEGEHILLWCLQVSLWIEFFVYWKLGCREVKGIWCLKQVEKVRNDHCKEWKLVTGMEGLGRAETAGEVGGHGFKSTSVCPAEWYSLAILKLLLDVCELGKMLIFSLC